MIIQPMIYLSTHVLAVLKLMLRLIWNHMSLIVLFITIFWLAKTRHQFETFRFRLSKRNNNTTFEIALEIQIRRNASNRRLHPKAALPKLLFATSVLITSHHN
jgi:hypothetical protein